VIECQNQVLGESLPVAGTGWNLNYRNSRTEGHKAAYTIRLPVKGDDDVVGYEALWIKIKIAGQRFELRFPRNTPEYYYDFIWDGKDAYGRTVQGQQKAYIRFAYEYKVTYVSSGGFRVRNLPSSTGAAYVPPPWEDALGVPNKPPGRNYDALWSSAWQVVPLGSLWDARGLGLGGWMLDVQHAYSPITRALILGNGKQRTSVNLLGAETSTMVPQILYGGLLATAPDGSVYFTENYQVKRRLPTGTVETVAGNGYCFTPPVEGGNAQQACFSDISNIHIDNAGQLYIAGMCRDSQQNGYGCLRRVAPDGTITTVAGGGSHTVGELADPNYTGNLLASEVNFDRIDKVVIDEESNIYLVAAQLTYYGSTSSIYQIDSYGFVRLLTPGVAGGAIAVVDFEMEQDGSLLVSIRDSGAWWDIHGKFIRVLPNGTQVTYDFADALTLLAQSDGYSSCPNLLTVAPTGIVYATFSDCAYPGVNSRLFQLDFEEQRLTLFAGGGSSQDEHVAATATNLLGVTDLVTAPDGIMYFTDYVNNGTTALRRLGPVLPGVQMQDISIASEDGSEIYVFNRGGKHLRTVDAVTGKTLIEFTHDDKGYVTQITDIDGEVTTIERDESHVTALVAPHGQRTEFELDANGYLQQLTNPANESHQMSYTDAGLLTQFTNPRGHTSVMTYDTVGRLVSDRNAAGGGWQLTRSDAKDSYTVALHSQLGRTTEYQTDIVSPTEQRRITKHPDGTQTLETELANGVSVQTLPDGTQITN